MINYQKLNEMEKKEYSPKNVCNEAFWFIFLKWPLTPLRYKIFESFD